MYRKNGIVYSEAYSFLINDKGEKGFSFPYNGRESFIEKEIGNYVDIHVCYKIIDIGGILIFDVDYLTKDEVKKYIIKSRYSYDDQIAIILNKGDSDDNKVAFERMQLWRKFADDIANKVIKTNIL